MMNALNTLSEAALRQLYQALRDQVLSAAARDMQTVNPNVKIALINAILSPDTWSRVILYRSPENTIWAALPAPPYYPQIQDISQEADLTGPFPFRYACTSSNCTNDDNKIVVIDTSLVYLSPEWKETESASLPSLDLVPMDTCPNDTTRHVRYAALLGPEQAPAESLATVKLLYAEFTRQYHLKRQAMLENVQQQPRAECTVIDADNRDPPVVDTILKVFTDTNDPMELGHPQAGLDPTKYQLVHNFEDADIIFSYQSMFSVLSKYSTFLQDASRTLYINQFPYEGAYVQKDHLAMEVLKQHGLPRPSWSIETYDLDVQLGVFVGVAILSKELQAMDDGEDSIWIVKPARGTQSKGHLITKSAAHILRLVDAGIHSWVVQRYIQRPICYQGRKVDCRCIVMLGDVQVDKLPTLYMHKRVYFRIASKVHKVDTPVDLLDHESVLTAAHLLTQDYRDTEKPLQQLPVDAKTIAILEAEYTGFDWNGVILPKIHEMIRELFNGMTKAFPGMAQGKHKSRAVYGVDIMFELQSDDSVEVKLTEVTFCPANNAVCDAYEHDEELYQTFNTDVFDCLFRNQVSERITRLQ
jgi:hypothetical protein